MENESFTYHDFASFLDACTANIFKIQLIKNCGSVYCELQ